MRLYLIGLPGVGKSRIGQLLSRKLKLDFYDTDKIIEQKTNQVVKDIIRLKGESYFRRLETETLIELLKIDGVIACGGGVVEVLENKNYLQGIVIYLKTDPKDLSFTKEELEQRPLLETRGIENLYRKRAEKYQQFSHLIIDVSHKSDDEIISEVVNYYENINH
ncbi:MAG: shikimate kinase [Acholeplasmataceae bacterium]|jgi:shikimate kinase